MMKPTRREFLATAVGATAALATPSFALAQKIGSFQLSILTDEISQDFDHACSVASKDLGLEFVDLRALWGKNVTDLGAGELSRVKNILARHNLRVSDIAGPLFKADWPGAPRSRFNARQNFAKADFTHQHNVLSRCLSLAEQFKADKIRCFDFWRLEDVAPHRAAIDNLLRIASDTAAKEGCVLVLVNDHECNTATAAEAARLLQAVPNLMLNWDPANAVMGGELDAFPVGWELLPKDRIRHCQCKNVARNTDGKLDWSPVDVGFIDWTAQFRALKASGFHGAVSLETHWRGAGTAEASSRVSFAAMKKALEAAGAL